jgi:hypothetical protein
MAHSGQAFGGLPRETGAAIPQAVVDSGLAVVRCRADSDTRVVTVTVEWADTEEKAAAKLAAQAVMPEDWTAEIEVTSPP